MYIDPLASFCCLGMFVEQMYYVVDDSDEDIIRISTLFVDLFMSMVTNVVQLWMSLAVSYHERYFNEVSSLGFQFYNDCSFMAHHLVHLSIATNHGDALITDNVRAKMEEQGEYSLVLLFCAFYSILVNCPRFQEW